MKEVAPGRDGEDADIVRRTGLHAIEAEGAIHVSRLGGLEEVEFATALGVVSAQAIMGAACGADAGIPHPDFQRGDEGGNEVELTDRANMFAEARAFEEAIHKHGGGEVENDDPCRPPRGFPEVEKLVGPEKEDQQADGEPLRAQESRPAVRGGKNPASEIPRKGERTRHAKKISCDQQGENAEASPVRPWKHPGEVHRPDLWSEKAVNHHKDGQAKKQSLHGYAEILRSNEGAENRHAQEIEWPARLEGLRLYFYLRTPPDEIGARQVFDGNDRSRQQKGHRTGHPHDRSGEGLVINRRKARDARRGGIGRIEDTAVECKKTGERGVLEIHHQQVGNEHPTRHSGSRRPGLHDGPPEKHRRREKTQVLDLMPSRGTQGELVEGRDVPKHI